MGWPQAVVLCVLILALGMCIISYMGERTKRINYKQSLNNPVMVQLNDEQLTSVNQSRVNKDLPPL